MNSEKWRCPKCGTLLGVRDGERLKIRYKKARYQIRPVETIEAICRNCGQKVAAK